MKFPSKAFPSRITLAPSEFAAYECTDER
jgi:hypothetical protein